MFPTIHFSLPPQWQQPKTLFAGQRSASSRDPEQDVLEIRSNGLQGTDENTLDYYRKNAEKFADMAIKAAQNAPELSITVHFNEAFGPLQQGATIVDIGAGVGNEMHLLQQHGYDAFGVEPVKELRNIAEKEYPDLENRLYDGSLPNNLPKQLEGKCDGIFSTATLQHISEDQLPEALESMKALLKPGGRVLLGMPFGRADYNPKTGRDGSGRLQLEYTPEALTRYFEKAGFKRIAFYGNNTDPCNRKLEWHNYIFELTQ